MVTFNSSELNKLKNIQQSLDNAQHQFYKICSKENPSLQEYVEKLNNESKTDWKIVCEEVLHINDKMKSIRSKVSSLDASITISLMKTELIALKDAIEGFKHTHNDRINTLQDRERILEDELNAYEQMYANWIKPVDIVEEPTFAKHLSLKKIECPEVNEFNRFLQENKGHTNGWSWSDNAMFVKMKTKFKAKEKVTENVHKIFPDKSVEEIEGHFNWHEKYCALRDKQRVAIRKWKARKQSVDEIDIEPLKPILKASKMPVTEDTKEKLRAWKEEKQKREHHELLSKEMNEQFYKELEMLKFQKKSELKGKVEKWRSIKEAEKQSLELKRREEELKTRAFKAMMAHHFIRDFQKQDLHYIKKRQANKTKHENKLPPTAKKEIPRDPERLLKPTKTWISKLTAKEEKPMHDIGGKKNLNLNMIQKLKAPDWRK